MARLALLALLSGCAAIRWPPDSESWPTGADWGDFVAEVVPGCEHDPTYCNQNVGCDLHDPMAVSLKKRLAGRARRYGRLVIYFIGDSLVRGQYYGLCKVATGELPDQSELHPFHGVSCQSSEVYAVFQWNHEFQAASALRVLVAEHPLPDAVYFDGGIHLLHIHPVRPMTPLRFKQLLHFQEHLQSFVLAWAAAAPEARLSVMPPNAICPEKYIGSWRNIIGDPHRSAKLCAGDMVAKDMGGKDIAASICERFLFTDVGARSVRQAINEAVQGLPMPPKEKTLVLDQHALTAGHCNQTCGGRHYISLVFQQLDLFFRANGW